MVKGLHGKSLLYGKGLMQVRICYKVTVRCIVKFSGNRCGVVHANSNKLSVTPSLR